MDKLLLKELILKTGIFVDNIYLEKYLNLCIENISTKKEKYVTEQHHIIPRCYFKSFNLDIDNSKNNLVNLKYKDHILAHYYLCGMIKDIDCVVYDKLCYAFYKMTTNDIKTLSEKDFINYFSKYDTYKKTWYKYVLKVGNNTKFKKGNTPWNKGLTKENNEIVRTISEKNSLNQIGKTPWNKGITKEMDDRLVKSASKRLHTLFEKTGYYGTNNGKKFSEETKEKMSKSMKSKHTNDIWINNGLIAKHVDVETYKDKYSDWNLGRKTKDYCFEPWNKGKHYTEEHRKKLSNSALNRKPMSDEKLKVFKDKCSLASKKKVNNRDYLYYCLEDDMYFKSLIDIKRAYGISTYFIQKSIDCKIKVNDKTFFKIFKEDILNKNIEIYEIEKEEK